MDDLDYPALDASEMFGIGALAGPLAEEEEWAAEPDEFDGLALDEDGDF